MCDQSALTGKLEHRYTEPYYPIKNEQTIVVPEEISFGNYLVGYAGAADEVEFQFYFKDDSSTDLDTEKKLKKNSIQSFNNKIRKIVYWYKPTRFPKFPSILLAWQLLDSHEEVLAQSGMTFAKKNECVKSEAEIHQNERIIGIKAAKVNDHQAVYQDFQFIIGKLA